MKNKNKKYYYPIFYSAIVQDKLASLSPLKRKKEMKKFEANKELIKFILNK